MSRCFPFPPPGYVKIGAESGGGAIEMESIKCSKYDSGALKLHKEKKRAEKEQRKEKKRLKKEKKGQLKKQTEASGKLNVTKSLPNNKTKRDSCAFDGRALSDDSTKSGLSEEHDLPLPSNFFEPSGGNDSTKKRKRDDPVPPISERNGTKLKVSFTFKKPIEASVVQNHSASKSLSTRRDGQPCSTSQAQPLSYELPTNTGRDAKTVLDGANVKQSHSHKRKTSVSKHRALFEEWCPLPLLSEEESSDQEWLFGVKQRVTKVARKNGISDALTMCREAYNSFPRADYLPEAEIYVLPFTVPF